MSWSHFKSGPSLEVAREVEKEGTHVQSYLSGAEKSLHARAQALIICACHETKHGYINVEASGHASYVYDANGADTGIREQNLTIMIRPMSKPVEVPAEKEVIQSTVENVEIDPPLVLQEPAKDPVDQQQHNLEGAPNCNAVHVPKPGGKAKGKCTLKFDHPGKHVWAK